MLSFDLTLFKLLTAITNMDVMYPFLLHDLLTWMPIELLRINLEKNKLKDKFKNYNLHREKFKHTCQIPLRLQFFFVL